jgi:hypothetical protein
LNIHLGSKKIIQNFNQKTCEEDLSSEIQADTEGNIKFESFDLAGARDFSFLWNVHTSLGAYPASYSAGTGGEVAGAQGFPLASM